MRSGRSWSDGYIKAQYLCTVGFRSRNQTGLPHPFRASRIGSKPSANDRNRSLGKRESCVHASRDLGFSGRSIRIGFAPFATRVPLVLVAPERNHIDRTAKRPVRIRCRVMEYDVHGVRLPLVLVNDEQGPLTIRTKHCVSRYDGMFRGIFNVGAGGKSSVCAVPRLDPFQINQLAREELRCGLLDLIIRINREHAEYPLEPPQPW